MDTWLGLALGVGLLGSAPDCPHVGFLYQPAFRIDDCLRLPWHPYYPQPGDIFLASDNTFLMKYGHRAALSGCPQHSAIIIALPEGGLALVEAGPHNALTIDMIDVFEHLHSHEVEGERVWIRQRATPLTPEQSAELTAFVLPQVGKRFALWRMCTQITPFRARGSLRLCFMGKPHGPCRSSYFCSELVTESLVAAGALNGETARPSSTFPRELFFGRSANLYLDKHLEFNCGWLPPARWTSCPDGPYSKGKFPTFLDGPAEIRK